MKYSALILLLFCSLNASSQLVLSSTEEVINAAKRELDASMKEGELAKFRDENAISGVYTFRIMIKEKGRVNSVSIVNRAEGTIDHQNRIKDFLMDMTFSFKTPKKQFYNFEHTSHLSKTFEFPELGIVISGL
jgi:hypothetical protein